jgi:DNA-binding transcriptional LysR family regulator
MAVVVPEGHRLAHRKSVRLAELAKDDWVSLSNAFFPGRREFLHGCCARAGFEPRVVAELDSLPLMLASVATGSGVAIIPVHARKLPHGGCVFVPLASPVLTTRLLLVTPKRDLPSGLSELAALLADYAAALKDA